MIGPIKMGWLRRRPITRKDTASGSYKQLNYGMSSMQGWRRTMEDAHNVSLTLPRGLKNWSFVGVFDGHSGKNAAQYASSKLLSNIVGRLQAPDPIPETEPRRLQDAIKMGFLNCDNAMKESRKITDNSGTTASCVLLSPENIYFANCGDSRAILCRSGQVHFATKDHKPNSLEEKKRIVKAGGFVKRRRVVGRLALSRSLGDFKRYKENKRKSQTEQMVVPLPDVTVIERDFQRDEFIVVACDGIFDVMSNEELIAYIQKHMSRTNNLTSVCSRVIDECFQKNSTDNMSIIILNLRRFTGHMHCNKHVQRKRKADLKGNTRAKRTKYGK